MAKNNNPKNLKELKEKMQQQNKDLRSILSASSDKSSSMADKAQLKKHSLNNKTSNNGVLANKRPILNNTKNQSSSNSFLVNDRNVKSLKGPVPNNVPNNVLNNVPIMNNNRINPSQRNIRVIPKSQQLVNKNNVFVRDNNQTRISNPNINNGGYDSQKILRDMNKAMSMMFQWNQKNQKEMWSKFNNVIQHNNMQWNKRLAEMNSNQLMLTHEERKNRNLKSRLFIGLFLIFLFAFSFSVTTGVEYVRNNFFTQKQASKVFPGNHSPYSSRVLDLSETNIFRDGVYVQNGTSYMSYSALTGDKDNKTDKPLWTWSQTKKSILQILQTENSSIQYTDFETNVDSIINTGVSKTWSRIYIEAASDSKLLTGSIYVTVYIQKFSLQGLSTVFYLPYTVSDRNKIGTWNAATKKWTNLDRDYQSIIISDLIWYINAFAESSGDPSTKGMSSNLFGMLIRATLLFYKKSSWPPIDGTGTITKDSIFGKIQLYPFDWRQGIQTNPYFTGDIAPQASLVLRAEHPDADNPIR